jgi:hypothetical protein
MQTVLLATSGNTLFFLLDSMQNDEGQTGDSFIGNKRLLAEAWKAEELWCVGTTEDIDGDVQSATNVSAAQYDVYTDAYVNLFPACLWVKREDNVAQIVWVHSKFRRRTIASTLVRARKPAAAENVESIAGMHFWKALGYTEWIPQTKTLALPF